MGKLAAVHAAGIVMGQIGLVSSMGQWQGFLATAVREFSIHIQKALQALGQILHLLTKQRRLHHVVYNL